jgi:hypothetical protein
MSAGAAVASKQNRYLRRFEAAGATDADHATTPEQAGCRSSFVFNGLVRRGIFVEVSDGRYYLDLEMAEAFRERRRLIGLVSITIALLALLLWLALR